MLHTWATLYTLIHNRRKIKMITITYENFMAALALFTALCVASGWLIKIIKGVKKPTADINGKLDNDNKRIKYLEDKDKYNAEAIKLLMRSELAILGHLSTNNNSGDMKKVENDIRDFLLNY